MEEGKAEVDMKKTVEEESMSKVDLEQGGCTLPSKS